MDKELDVASDRAYISTLSRYLSAIGAHVTILSRYRDRPKEYPDASIVYVRTVSLSILKRLSYLLSVFFRLLILSLKTNPRVPDVIVIDRPTLVFATLPAVLICRLRRSRSPRFVLDVRSLPNDPDQGLKGRVTWFLFNAGLRLASGLYDGCMAITPAMARYIAESSKFKADGIGLWSSAFDANIFNPDTTVLDSKLNTSDRITLVYHGAIAPNRMLIETVEALSICSADVQLLLIGDGELLPKLKERVSELGLVDRVSFIDPVEYERVPGFLLGADIGIVPIPNTLWFEVSMPIKLLEYMAMKLPIIAPLTTPVKTVIEGSSCDVEPFEITGSDQQPEAIATAIDNAALKWGKSHLSSANRERVLVRFSWEAQAGNILHDLARLNPVDVH